MLKMKELYEKVAADSALQERYSEILGKAQEIGQEATGLELINFAKEQGYDVTAKEIGEFFQSISDDLDMQMAEEELDAVAGGKGGGGHHKVSAVYAFFPPMCI